MESNAMGETKTWSGGCHCGSVRFDVNLDISAPMTACNCSICQKTGTLLAFVDSSAFTLKQGESSLRDYQFGKKHVHHMFCDVCGVRTFGSGATPEGGEMYAVNARLLDGVDARELEVTWFEGRDL